MLSKINETFFEDEDAYYLSFFPVSVFHVEHNKYFLEREWHKVVIPTSRLDKYCNSRGDW